MFTPSAPPGSASGAADGALPHASPQVHRVARELGFDLRGADPDMDTAMDPDKVATEGDPREQRTVQDSDSIEDFRDGIDFDEVFVSGYEPPLSGLDDEEGPG